MRAKPDTTDVTGFRSRDPSGKRDDIALVEPAVQGLATAIRDDGGLLKVFTVIAEQQELLLVLEDLIASLANQDHKTINCARCVEAVRQLIAGYGVEPKKQWPILKDKLNLETSYLKLITDHPKDHRHGKQTGVDPAIVTEIMVRTWTIIYRFFHFRLGGDQKLDTTQFPIVGSA